MARRAALRLPPILLAVVAVAQIALAHTVGLMPWKGGGFGMFSTLDQSFYRGVNVVIDAPGRSETIAIPPSLRTAAERAAAYPVDALFRRLADGIVARERLYARPVTRVTLTAWRTEFDRGTLRANARPLRTFVYDVH